MGSDTAASSNSVRGGRRRLPIVAAWRLALFSFLWLVLTQGDPGSWPVGAVTIVTATLLSLVLAPRLPLPSVRRSPGFAAYFIWQSLLGGIDVVKRALAPAMPIEPDFVPVELHGLDNSQRLAFVFLVSLLPGTLSVRLDGEILHVHILDKRMAVLPQLEELQARIQALVPGGEAGAIDPT